LIDQKNNKKKKEITHKYLQLHFFVVISFFVRFKFYLYSTKKGFFF